MYLLEMHCHCAPVSLCASITPEEEIAKYKAAGYSGIVSTNHINRSTFRDMEEKTWEENWEPGIEPPSVSRKTPMQLP